MLIKLVSLGLAMMDGSLTSACPCDTNCSNVSEKDHFTWCLTDCGFAVLQNVYDTDLLDNVREAFDRMFVNRSSTQKERILKKYGRDGSGETRGVHVEVGLPSMYPFNKAEVLYNHNVSKLLQYYFSDPVFVGEGGVALEMVTAIHNPPGFLGVHQEWHIDSGDFPRGIKVHTPLVDVSPDMGPVELSIPTMGIEPLFHINRMYLPEEEAEFQLARERGLLRECTFKGVVKRGTVVVYMQALPHRGTPNLSGRSRDILDFSFMTARMADDFADAYDDFPNAFGMCAMPEHRRIYKEQHGD